MAHLLMPPGGDPDTAAWLRLPRWRRRQARAAANAYLKSAGYRKSNPALTKTQRRQATPWQPIVLPAGDAHFLSGNMRSESARLILLGLNRRERRALGAKSGPRGDSIDQLAAEVVLGGHVSRDRRLLPLLSRAHLYHRAESRRRMIADAQEFEGSWRALAFRTVAMMAAVPMVSWKRIRGALKNLLGGGS